MRMRALRFGVGAIRALHYTTWQTDLITSDSLALSHRRVASERNKVYDAVSSDNLRASVRWINPSVRPSLPPGLRYSHLSLLSSPPPGRVSPRDWREKSAAAAVWRSPSVFRVSWSACACFSHTNIKHTPPRAPVQVRHACVRVETQREARAHTRNYNRDIGRESMFYLWTCVMKIKEWKLKPINATGETLTILQNTVFLMLLSDKICQIEKNNN